MKESGQALWGVQGGMAPYVLSLLRSKKICEDLLQNVQPPVTDSKTRSQVGVCIIIVKEKH